MELLTQYAALKNKKMNNESQTIWNLNICFSA
jgi:hypothetical protein